MLGSPYRSHYWGRNQIHIRIDAQFFDTPHNSLTCSCMAPEPSWECILLYLLLVYLVEEHRATPVHCLETYLTPFVECHCQVHVILIRTFQDTTCNQRVRRTFGNDALPLHSTPNKLFPCSDSCAAGELGKSENKPYTTACSVIKFGVLQLRRAAWPARPERASTLVCAESKGFSPPGKARPKPQQQQKVGLLVLQ